MAKDELGVYSNWVIKYKQDLILLIIIITIPFALYIHLFFNDSTDQLVILGQIVYHEFGNNQNFIWQLLSAFISIFILVLIFFTTQRRWKYFLIPLIVLYCDRLFYFMGFNDESFNSFLTFRGILGTSIVIVALVLTDRIYFSSYRHKSFVSSVFTSLNIKNQLLINLKDLKKIQLTFQEKNKIKEREYLSKVFYLQTILDRQLKDIKNKDSKNSKVHNVKYDLFLIIIILSNTLLWFVPYTIPELLTEVDLFWFTINSHGFLDVHIFIWWVVNKFVVLIPILIWYLTSSYWWKHGILVPFFMYSFQIWEAFQDIRSLDAIGNIKTFPILVLMIGLLIMLSNLIKRRFYLIDYRENLSAEIESLIIEISRRESNDLENELNSCNLKNETTNEEFLQRLNKLNSIKNSLLRKLDIKF